MKKYFTPILVTVLALFGVITFNQTAGAADMSKFNAGNIMSDYVMSNKNSMTEAQIQQFLTNKNPCNDTNTAKAAQYPNMTYNIKDGKFVCLSKEVFNGETAAKIIWQAAQDYNINPQVLIVLLQKEQGLVTDTWPNHNVQYRSATGYGCPDNADCNSKYYGFKNQVRNAANFFRAHLDNRSGWNKPHVPGVSQVRYSPVASCGSSSVNIENRATSGLYSYTPYQPNSAALRAGYGKGDGCSAYGNRNFWAYFNDWFGSTQGDGFVSLDDPRWMRLKQDTQKRNVLTDEKFGPILNKGKDIKYLDKVLINNVWYLRTEWDKSNSNKDGIPLSEVEEVPVENIPKKWISITSATTAIDPIRDKKINTLDGLSSFNPEKKITVDGSTHYIIEQNTKNTGIKIESAESFRWFDLLSPRSLVTTSDVPLVNITTNERVDSLAKNTLLYYNKRNTINNTLYVQPEKYAGTNIAVEYGKLREISKTDYNFVSLDDPRWMRLKQDTQKRNILTGEKFGPILSKGRDIKYLDKVLINDVWYLRTEWDKSNGNKDGIPLSEVEEVPVESISPTLRYLRNNTQKIDPLRNIPYEKVTMKDFPSITFVDKIIVDGNTYYRTAWEKQQGNSRYIPANHLR